MGASYFLPAEGCNFGMERHTRRVDSCPSKKIPKIESDSPNPVYGTRPSGSQRGVSISGQEQNEKEEGGEVPGDRKPGQWRTCRVTRTEKLQVRASQNSQKELAGLPFRLETWQTLRMCVKTQECQIEQPLM